MVTTSSNKEIQQHKGAACHIFLENLTVKEAQTHLERVRGYERHGPTISTSTTFGSEECDSSEPLTDIQDPAIILVCAHKLIWLAVVEIYKIKKGGVLVDKIALRLLSKPNVRVMVKVLSLKPSNDEDSQGDWHWFVGFEKSTIELPGQSLQLINPDVLPLAPSKNHLIPGFVFQTSELIAIGSAQYSKHADKLDCLLSVSWTDTFPYHGRYSSSFCPYHNHSSDIFDPRFPLFYL